MITDAFLNRIAPRIICPRSRTRKFKQYLALLLFGAFAGSAAAQTTLTYDDGDLFLGFRCTDRPSDYLINILQPAQFVNAPPGSTFQVDVGSTSADLIVAFGSDWFTRIDPITGRKAVFWAVTGGREIAASGDPQNTLYSTNPIAAPWPRHSDGGQSITTSLIAQLGNNFAGNLSTVNNPRGLIQNAPSNNSYASFQPGGVNSAGISFQTWNPSNEAAPAISLFFDRIIPGSGPSTLLGTLTLNSSGQVSFTAAGASTPTPSPTATGTPGTPTPTPTVGPPTPTPTPTGTPTTPTPSPTPMVTLTPSPTPSAIPTTLGNISTRLLVETGDNALIGGFIVTGTQPKKVIVRAIGPSLSFAGALADPILELRDSSGALIMSNDNWRSDQEAEIIATGIPPSNNLESAIVKTLPANTSAYTAIVRGVGNGTGIALVEAYDLDPAADSELANISTRGLVQTGDNAMIAGTIVVGQGAQRVLVRALGPSLSVAGKLADPTLELRDANGAVIRANDNWMDDPVQKALIIATGIPPPNNLESAIVETLPANGAAYTAIVRGVNDTSGVALVEVYGLP